MIAFIICMERQVRGGFLPKRHFLRLGAGSIKSKLHINYITKISLTFDLLKNYNDLTYAKQVIVLLYFVQVFRQNGHNSEALTIDRFYQSQGKTLIVGVVYTENVKNYSI